MTFPSDETIIERIKKQKAEQVKGQDRVLMHGCIMAALTGLAANPVVLSRLEVKKRKKDTIDIEEELVRQAIRLGKLTFRNMKEIEE